MPLNSRRAVLIGAVEAAIGTLASVYKGSAHESDLYEAMVLATAVEAVQAAGGCTTFLDNAQPPIVTTNARFRRSPGSIWTRSYTHVQGCFHNFNQADKELEIHLGVFVAGGSYVAHEADIVLLDKREADRCRHAEMHPRRSKLIAVIEAKHYVAAPGLGVGRCFLGLATELGQQRCSLSFPACTSNTLGSLIASTPSHAFDEVMPSMRGQKSLQAHLEQQVRRWLSRRP